MPIKYREKCLKLKGEHCHACGSENQVLVHHINGDQDDRRIENLIPLCRGCHTKVHSDTRKNPYLDALTQMLPGWSLSQGRKPFHAYENYQPRFDTVDVDYGKITRVNPHSTIYLPPSYVGKNVKVGIEELKEVQDDA